MCWKLNRVLKPMSNNFCKFIFISTNLVVDNTTIFFLFNFCISHFLGEKLQYLQPLTEALLRFMENISHIHYECSLLIAKLMPSDIVNGELFTKFEHNTFCTFGEINYQVLKVNKQYIIFISTYMFAKFFSQYIFISFYRNHIIPIFWYNLKCYIY